MSGYHYYYNQREANFGAPAQEELSGGTHLTFDVILHQGPTLYSLRRPDGLHDGPKNSLYFPHGLIRFGESVHDCANRLALEQAGVPVVRTNLYTMPTWVDDNNHWHIALNVLAQVERKPEPSADVSEVVEVQADDFPADFAWWTREQMSALLAFTTRLVSVLDS